MAAVHRYDCWQDKTDCENFMATDIQSTIDELTSLSVNDRLRVVEAVWDSIGDDAPVTLSTSQREELDRRIDAHESNPDDMLTWDPVLRRVREKL
jgi:putative addiction module component (TIGR02574 family)